MAVTNPTIVGHVFLQGMYSDGYFPNDVVDLGAAILLRLCERIEADQPADLDALYALCRPAVEEFNALQEDFEAAGSEIETVGREVIAEGFRFVAKAYGFTGGDIERLIGGRDW